MPAYKTAKDGNNGSSKVKGRFTELLKAQQVSTSCLVPANTTAGDAHSDSSKLASVEAPLPAMNCSTSLCMALLSVSVSAEGRLSKIRQVLIINDNYNDNQYLPDLGQPALS